MNARTQETTTRRRRRDGAFDQSLSLKLGVEADKLDPKYQYRWINEGEHSRRLLSLTTQDDWDKVTSDEIGLEGKGPVRQAVGSQKNGQPEYAYLCRKLREFVDEDRREKHRIAQDRMDALRQGQTGPDTLNASDKSAYIPDEGISIRGG